MLKGQLLPAPQYPKGIPVWKVSTSSPHLHIQWTAFQVRHTEGFPKVATQKDARPTAPS